MKKTLMILTLAAGAALSAETTQHATAQKPQVCAANAAKACELTAEEQAFSAKLSDQNRKAFATLSPEQRQAAMESEKNGGKADEAVAKLASKHVSSHIANEDNKAASQNKAAK